MSGAAMVAALALDAALIPEHQAFDVLANAVTALDCPRLGELLAAYEAARLVLVSAVCDACAALAAPAAAVAVSSPMAKALAASQAADHKRLRLGASALNAAMPAHGVLFDRVMRVPGCAPVRVLFRWPGVLEVIDPASCEIIRESFAADMHDEAPAEAAFLANKAKARPLESCAFQPPQGAPMRATVDADGVVRVYAVKGGELLAESEPGRPTVLRAGFHSLSATDLLPRLT